jgi:hypothetical protein
LRLALKRAGLDPGTVDVSQLAVVFEKLMPAELECRGVEDAAATCRAVMNEVADSAAAAESPSSSSADEIFKRLGRD